MQKSLQSGRADGVMIFKYFDTADMGLSPVSGGIQSNAAAISSSNDEFSEVFSAFKSVDGVIITVKAPEGVVPTGTRLHAKKVSKTTLNKVNDAIGKLSETEDTEEPDYVFDIKLVYDGEKKIYRQNCCK